MDVFATKLLLPICKRSQERCEPMTDAYKITKVHHAQRMEATSPSGRRLLAVAAALPLLFLPGCKKEATPAVEVTVQAEKPEQGDISEHITVDAILSPLAQAAIAPKITAPVRKFYVQ